MIQKSFLMKIWKSHFWKKNKVPKLHYKVSCEGVYCNRICLILFVASGGELSQWRPVDMITRKFELTQIDSVYLQIFSKSVGCSKIVFHWKYNVENRCLNYLEKQLLKCHFCRCFPYRVKDFPEKIKNAILLLGIHIFFVSFVLGNHNIRPFCEFPTINGCALYIIEWVRGFFQIIAQAILMRRINT